MGQSFEVGILRPEGSFMGKGDGVDERVSEGEPVFDKEIGGGCGDSGVNGYDLGRHHAADDTICLIRASLCQNDFADFGEDDAGDEKLGEVWEL